MTDDEHEQILDLEDDGQFVKLDDDRIVRLRIEPDDSTSINDFDYLGKVEWIGNYWHHSRDPRPNGFTGNAEKMWAQQNGGQFWWEPPTDVPRTDPSFANLRELVSDVVSFGYSGLILELCEDTDAYGRPVVVDVASLWGIEPFPDPAYRRSVIGDLLSELNI